MLNKLEVIRRLTHIVVKYGEYDIKFMLGYFVKAQALADFVIKFSNSPEVINNEDAVEVYGMELKKSQIWKVLVYSAHNFKETALKVVILDHDRNCFEYLVQIDFQVMNNIVEYEAFIFGVITSKKLRANNIILHRIHGWWSTNK